MEDGSVAVYDGVRVASGRLGQMNGELTRAWLVTSSEVSRSALQRYIGIAFATYEVGKSSKPLTIAVRDMEILDQPLDGSTGSDAKYLLVRSDPQREELFLLQHLPPKAKTSVHWHPVEFEDFICLHGSCDLYTGELEAGGRARCKQARRLYPARYLRPALAYVQPREVHQLRTTTEEAYNIIKIRGTEATTLREIDHRYTEWR